MPSAGLSIPAAISPPCWNCRAAPDAPLGREAARVSRWTVSLPAPRPHLRSLAPFALADRTVAAHLRAIHLAQNENAPPPGAAALAAMRATLANVNRYPEADAVSLRQAIADAENLAADRVVCGAGSMELLALLAHAYVGPGDEIVISE